MREVSHWTHYCCVFKYMTVFQCILSLRESINSLKKKYSQSLEPTDSDAAIERTLNEVAKDGCQYLLDEVFLDLEVRRGLYETDQQPKLV